MKQRQVKLKMTLEEWGHLLQFLKECYYSMLHENGGLELILKIVSLEKFLIRLQRQISNWEFQGTEIKVKRQMTLDWAEYLVTIDCSNFEMDNYINMIFEYLSQQMPQEISQKMSANINFIE